MGAGQVDIAPWKARSPLHDAQRSVMSLLKFLRETVLLKEPKFERGALAPGPCLHRYFNKSFVLSIDRLDQIIRAMDETIASCCTDQRRELTLLVHTGKGTQWKEASFKDVSEIRTYFNAASNRLRSIFCRVQAESMVSLVVFQDYGPGWTCAIVVEGGRRDEAGRLFERLSDYVKETFQWYSLITSMRVALLAIASYLAWSVWMLWSRVRSGRSFPVPLSNVEMSTVQWILTIAVALVCLTVVIFIGVLLIRLVDFLFPKGIFLIGQEIHRYNTVVSWRKTLLTGLAFPFLIALYRTLFG